MSPMIPRGLSFAAVLALGCESGAAVLDEKVGRCATGGRCATFGTSWLQSSYSRDVAKLNFSTSSDCEDLKEVTIGGKSIGLLLSPLCSMWPSGDFPIKSLPDAKKILDPIFEEDGVWDWVRGLSKNRTDASNPKFCWRHQQMRRTVVKDSTKGCPSPIGKKEARSLLDEKDADRLKHGMWNCRKSSHKSDTCSCEKQACVTTGRNLCVFPFFHEGEKYTSCTTKGHDRPWCATKTDSHGHFISTKWDNCGPACDEATYEHHAGACRNASQGVGRHKQFARAEKACKETCSEEPSCIAYEFGAPDKCEIHSGAITLGNGRAGYACFIKDQSQPYEHHAGECRDESGGWGRYKKLTLAEEECKETCSADSSCIAYEFGAPDMCAIMSDAITHGNGRAGYRCNIKEAGTREEVSAVPSGCDMVSWGKCYDMCHEGYEPLSLTGGFRPICQTKCSESHHHIDCGYGCANRVSSCVNAVVEQIGAVVKSVSKVISVVSGQQLLFAVFDALVSLVEFVVTTLPKLIDFFRSAWDKLGRKLHAGEEQVGIILALMELAREAGSSFIGKFLEMQESVKQIPNMFQALLSAEWGWGFDLNKVSSILGQFGASEIGLGFKLVKAFSKPKCEVADRTPFFSITNVGDERLKGTWMRQGSHLGRPRYSLLRDSDNSFVPTIHWSKNEYWRAFVDNKWYWGRQTLYINRNSEETVPLDGWEVSEGAWPAPTLQNT